MEAENIIEDLYHNHARNIQRLCYLYLGDAAASEDAMKETFLKAYEKYPLFRGNSDIKTWLTRIAINTCKDMQRRDAGKNVFPAAEVLENTQHATDVPEKSIEKLLVSEAIHRLPRELREVVILFYYQELTTRTISTVLHIPRTTVEFRLKKARGELKKVIREDYL